MAKIIKSKRETIRFCSLLNFYVPAAFEVTKQSMFITLKFYPPKHLTIYMIKSIYKRFKTKNKKQILFKKKIKSHNSRNVDCLVRFNQKHENIHGRILEIEKLVDNNKC